MGRIEKHTVACDFLLCDLFHQQLHLASIELGYKKNSHNYVPLKTMSHENNRGEKNSQSINFPLRNCWQGPQEIFSTFILQKWFSNMSEETIWIFFSLKWASNINCFFNCSYSMHDHTRRFGNLDKLSWSIYSQNHEDAFSSWQLVTSLQVFSFSNQVWEATSP